MKRIIVFSLLVCLFVGACSKQKQKETELKFKGQNLLVCSGAGLIKPMNELIELFQKKTGANVQVHYGGSAEIFGILQTTGNCDVFIPGALYYTQLAVKKGLVLKDTVKNLVYHIPVIITPAHNPKHIKNLKDLDKPGVKVVLGDPKACAIGKVAKKILEKNGLWEDVKKNILTFTPTVNQLLIYIITGQADAGIIWEDMTTWAEGKGKLTVIPIPSNQNIIKTIPTAVTIYAQKHQVYKAAVSFNDFVSSHPQIWQKWGFKPCVR